MAMTKKQLEVVDMLSQGMKVTDIAKQLNVSHQYISQVKQHPEYSLTFAVACQDRIKGMLPKAIQKLERILASDDPDLYRTQIQAVKMILDYSHVDVVADAVRDAKQPKKVTIKYE